MLQHTKADRPKKRAAATQATRESQRGFVEDSPSRVFGTERARFGLKLTRDPAVVLRDATN
jgi:hypothetical protein